MLCGTELDSFKLGNRSFGVLNSGLYCFEWQLPSVTNVASIAHEHGLVGMSSFARVFSFRVAWYPLQVLVVFSLLMKLSEPTPRFTFTPNYSLLVPIERRNLKRLLRNLR